MNWSVYIPDNSPDTVKIYNVFEHSFFVADCRQALKKHPPENGENAALYEAVLGSLMRHFHSKAQWETKITTLLRPGENYMKTDPFKQIMLNPDAFMEYVINHAEEIKKI